MGEAPEMDSAAQAADILASLALPKGTPLLDGGCAAGHFIHSLKKRQLGLAYQGLDYSPSFIEMGKGAFLGLSLDPGSLSLGSLDDLADVGCEVAVLLNVLSFNPDFRRILDRVREAGARTILVRDNFGEQTSILWERDGFLDPGFNHLKGYWNRWGRADVEGFLGGLGYAVSWIEDRRTKGQVEMVVGKPYTWGFFLAQRRG
jgi:trans-aconitate methyltransferase